MQEVLLIKMLEVQQIMRHDFLNHIQVIYGFLQIGYSEKAKEYSLKAVESMQHYNKLGRISLPLLQCFLTWFVVQLNDEQAAFTYDLNGDLQQWLQEDSELTRILMILMGSVLNDFLQKKLRCQLTFVDKVPGFRLSFEGEEASIDYLKGVDLSSQKLLLIVDEALPEKWAVTIKKITGNR